MNFKSIIQKNRRCSLLRCIFFLISLNSAHKTFHFTWITKIPLKINIKRTGSDFLNLLSLLKVVPEPERKDWNRRNKKKKREKNENRKKLKSRATTFPVVHVHSSCWYLIYVVSNLRLEQCDEINETIKPDQWLY